MGSSALTSSKSSTSSLFLQQTRRRSFIFIFIVAILISFFSCVVDAQQQQGEDLVTQEEDQGIVPNTNKRSDYYISEPTLIEDPEKTTSLEFDLLYNVSVSVPIENIKYTLYDSHVCHNGGNDISENDYLTAEVVVDDKPEAEAIAGDDDEDPHLRLVKLKFKINPDTIRTSPIFDNNSEGDDAVGTTTSGGVGNNLATLKFCVKLSSYTADARSNPGAIEIFVRETAFTFRMSQDGPLEVEQDIISNLPTNIIDDNVYELVGYLCNIDDNSEIIDPRPIYQGMIVQVCVTPNSRALQDNIYMHSIDSFYWTRESIYQPAIVPSPNQVAASSLTFNIQCLPGMTICTFQTILKNSFFYKLGDVVGYGIGWLQYGKNGYEGPSQPDNSQTFVQQLKEENKNTNENETADNPNVANNSTDTDTNNGAVEEGSNQTETPEQVIENAQPETQEEEEKEGVSGTVGRRLLHDATTAAAATSSLPFKATIRIRPRGALAGERNGGSSSTTTATIASPYNVKQQQNDHGEQQYDDDRQSRVLQTTTNTNTTTTATTTTNNEKPENFAGSSNFNVSVPVARLYVAIGYLCDQSYKQLDPLFYPLTIRNNLARVCVTPTMDAQLLDNVKIRSIDKFIWTRNDLNLTQDAIISNQIAAIDGQTSNIHCQPGKTVCSFETLLNLEFFQSSGKVQGYGVVWLQFGDNGPTRKLQFSLEDYPLGNHLLQTMNMDDGFAGTSRFNPYVLVLQQQEANKNLKELYQCRAYQCDEQNKEYVSNDPLSLEGRNNRIRICVTPSSIAKRNGASMWMIDWWNWQRQNYTQVAIENQGFEATDGRTVQICYRGNDVCSFTTVLNERFFNSSGAIEGIGYCWLTFGGGNNHEGDEIVVSAAITADGGSEADDVEDGYKDKNEKDKENEPIVPNDDPLYAGEGEIGIIMPVTGNWRFVLEECPPEDHDIWIWWDDLDGNDRNLYTFIMVGAGMSYCCTLLCCWFCGFGGRRRRYEEYTIIEDKSKNGTNNIEVNVDVEDILQQRIINHEQHHYGNKHGINSMDVCFGDDKHPGTLGFNMLIKSYMKELQKGNTSSSKIKKFDSDLYRTLKERVPSTSRYYTRRRDSDSDSEDYKSSTRQWEEVTKKNDLIRFFGECWSEERKKQQQQRQQRK